ncbi:MAG: hypothetical protein DMF53_02160, partial [Acidobacteria bacterium]
APTGSILAVSASPTRIALNGQSTITVVGRKPDGNPLNPGTEVHLSATLGTLPAIVTTDRTGTATAVFQSDGRLGTAMITASLSGSTSSGGSTGGSGGSGGSTGGSGSGSGTGSASLQIEVGSVAGSIVLQPTPTTLTISGGTVRLLAIVRDASGAPLVNQGVNFTADYGTLNSRGGIVTTDASGEAHDKLTLTAADLQGNVSSVMVTAQTVGGGSGSSGGTSLLSDTATIHIQGGPPHASFNYTQGSTDQTVDFTSTSTGGQGALSYSWNFGDSASGVNNTSTDPNPVHLYLANGNYVVRLIVLDTNNQSSAVTTQIKVPVGTGGSSGS